MFITFVNVRLMQKVKLNEIYKKDTSGAVGPIRRAQIYNTSYNHIVHVQLVC